MAVLASQECDHSQTDSLEDEEIEVFYRMLTQRVEIDNAFAEAAGSGETLSVDQLVTFLKHQQREEEAGPALALSLIERYEPSETGEGLAIPGPHAWENPKNTAARDKGYQLRASGTDVLACKSSSLDPFPSCSSLRGP